MGRRTKFFIPSSGRRFLMRGDDCLPRCVNDGLEVVTPGRDPGFFMAVTEKEGSGAVLGNVPDLMGFSGSRQW